MRIIAWCCTAIIAAITAFHPKVATIDPVQLEVIQHVPEIPADLFADRPVLKRICSCESWGRPDRYPRQFDSDGNVITGNPNPDDKGACQINLPTWGTLAQKLGYDLFQFSGNVKMAIWIADNDSRHLKNWEWSASCWKPK